MKIDRKKPFGKRVALGSLVTAAAAVGFLCLFMGFQALNQHIWVPSEHRIPKQLTADQKRSDFQLLTQITAEYYPFQEANVSVKGLDELTEINAGYIERAGQTNDNQEFLSLFYEYLQRVHQTGHAYLVPPQEAEQLNTFGNRMLYGLKKENFQTADYWYMLCQDLSTGTYSDLTVAYRNGGYYLSESCSVDGFDLPKGSQLVKINDMEIDQYVRSLQNRHFLRFDQANCKVFLPDPFSVNNQDGKDSWNVQIRLKEGNLSDFHIEKKYGIKKDPRFSDNPFNRNFCMELTEDTAYIRVFSFLGSYENDLEMIRDFMENPQKEYRKLILDVRGNGGGSPEYWMKALVQPLLKNEVLYERKAAMQKDFPERFGVPLPLYQKLGGGLFNKESYFFQEAVKIRDQSEAALQTYLVTRRFTPSNTLLFDGEVYLLVDNDCFSAAEDFISTMKVLKLGTIAGTYTQGGGASFLPPFPFCLPESGILFVLEPEITYNSDGSINEIYGTEPDVLLEHSAYPTPYPLSADKEELMGDPWVQWALKQ